MALCGVRPHAAMYRNHCCSRQLQSPGPARDPRHRKQTRLEWRSGQEEHQLGSHQLKAAEADRGMQVEDGGGYTDSRPSAMASCEVHPAGKDGWVPRVGGKLEWVIAHAP